MRMIIFVVMKRRRIEDDASRFAIVDVVIVIGEGSVQCLEERCVCFCLFEFSFSVCECVCWQKWFLEKEDLAFFCLHSKEGY